MITPAQKKGIIKWLGKHYSKKIIDRLNKHNTLNAKGEPYKPDSIQNIMNGQENLIVEKHIFKAAAIAKRQHERELKTRKEIIKK